ncbi:hypothetical protein [Hoyosella altamirensis]|uniref:Phenylacetate-coenzyme A ligase PaaK-like adenylate-forming protein n=1 Tax=Hoyosella altamirensis TaxID=616997 RepID=A0A839RRV3_9ACTN|nr:hypothetical protein [Hoyosella altamirensis]MBB3039585.1 phenylacetate-coenzyme A ligase PaaK-like adenylate-forming protein [Hoyosella altamirensis]
MTMIDVVQRIPLSAGSKAERLAERQSTRLTELVGFVREHSPYYARLYSGLPEVVTDPAVLPITDKIALMENFDDWATDREITRESADTFLKDLDKIGSKYLGKYSISSTSGTSGYRGIFLMSSEEIATARKLNALPHVIDFLKSEALSGGVWRLVRGRMRSASILATGGHHILNSLRTQHERDSGNQPENGRNKVLSVFQPVSELVRELNAFQPVMLNGYGSVASILASEQEKGTLSIRPAIVATTGDGLPRNEYARIEKVFGARVVDSYGCSEAITMTRYCTHGWHHVLSDWIILEPVDRHFEPTPPGTLSHTTLLSVLYRKAQPILRYNLGDAVIQRPDPCPCGNPHPAVRVQGRSADLLHSPDGEPKTTAALIVESLAARAEGIQQLQLKQSGRYSLLVRLVPACDRNPEEVWSNALRVLGQLLVSNGLDGYSVERDTVPPEISAGGKFRQFIPLSQR